MTNRRNSRSNRIGSVTAGQEDPPVQRISRQNPKRMCNKHAAEGHHVPKVAKVIGKTLCKKRKPKAPQADANSGSGEARLAGPGIDASPARQTSGRNAGSPKGYKEVPERKAAYLRGGHGHSKAAGPSQGRAPRLEGGAAAKRDSNPKPFQQVQQTANRYLLRRNHIDGQVAQLRVHVPTAEESAAASSRHEGEGEGQQQLEFEVEGGSDSRAGGSSSVLLNTAMDDGSGNEAARRQDGHQCYKCGSEESPAWRRGNDIGLFHEHFWCNSCGTQQKRYGAEFDPMTGQVTYPTTPKKKDRAQGSAGKGGQAVVLHHDFDAILEAAAAAEEGNLLQHSAEVAGEGRVVDSTMDSSRASKGVSSNTASSAAPERQAAMERGGSSGQQKRKRGVAERAQSGAGAEGAQSANQKERQQRAQLATSKTAARQQFDSHVGNASSCSGGVPSRKRAASAASPESVQDKKCIKTVHVAAFSNTAAHAAGGMQHVQLNGTAGRGQDGLGAEESRKNEMSGSSQHMYSVGRDEMVDRADSLDEQEAVDVLLWLGNIVA